MIIPVGFGRSLPEKPWLSLTVCAVVCFVSIPFIATFSKTESSMLASAELARFYQIQESFTRKNCAVMSGMTEACQVVQQVLQGRTKASRNGGAEFQALGVNPKDFLGLTAKDRKFIFTWMAGLQQPQRFENITGLRPPEGSELQEAAGLIRTYEMHQYTKLGILTPENKTISAGVLSFLTHGGWMHLFGNLLILFFFLRILESRFSRFFLLAIFVGGGVGGLYFELWLRAKEVPGILGASAGVAAIIGCFWVSFFSRQVQVIFLDPTSWLGRQKIYLPVSWAIPVLVVTVDVIGALNNRITGSGVAHLAHLSGFAIGAAAGLVLLVLFPLPKGVLFPKEFDAIFQIKNLVGSPQEILDLCERVIDWNPDQILALKAGLKICFQNPGNESKFVLQRFPEFLQFCQKKKLDQSCLHVFNLVPIEYDSKKILQKTNLTTLNWLGRISLDHGNWWQALNCYSVVAEKYANKKSSGPVYQTIQKLVSFGLEKPENLSLLTKWIKAIQHPALKQMAERDFPQVVALASKGQEPSRAAG